MLSYKLTMSQLSFKFPPKELEFLKWYSERTAEPLGTIYRKVTLEHFIQWKKKVLLDAFLDGTIGIKQLANLGGMSFNECLLFLKQHNVDPPYNELLDQHSTQVMNEEFSKQKKNQR
jgi:hypothetical protein